MCDENHITSKVCACCGKELPISKFKRHGRANDGYRRVCNDCKAKVNSNPKLTDITSKELIDELRVRGYRDTIVYSKTYEVVM